MEQYCHKLQNFPRVPIKVTRAVIAIISSKRSSFLYDPASCSSKIVTAFTSIVELFSVRRRRLVSVSSSGKLFCLWNVKTIAISWRTIYKFVCQLSRSPALLLKSSMHWCILRFVFKWRHITSDMIVVSYCLLLLLRLTFLSLRQH